jgi:hypothetical protein
MMTCITFETLHTTDEGSVRRVLRRALSAGAAIYDGIAPRVPLGSRLARTAFRAHAQRRARAYPDFRMVDLWTLDDIGLVCSHVAAAGTPDNKNTAHGDVA